MNTLEDLLGDTIGSIARDQIGQNLGTDNSTVNNAIQIALPAILGGLKNNARDPEGAASINGALEKDHDGSLLDYLGDYLRGGVPAPQNADRQTDGTGILGHILGNSGGPVAKEISERTGMNTGQAANLLITLAPIVMAYLGKQKRANDVGEGGLADLIEGQAGLGAASGGSVLDLATGALDSDRDGSALDDLASMAADYFMK